MPETKDVEMLLSKWATPMRGLAIIAVVGIHISAFASSYYYGSVAQNLILYGDVILHFAVPLFIIFTSYFLFLKYSVSIILKDYYKKRVRKILIPYILVSVLYSVLAMIMGKGLLTISGILGNIWNGDAAVHLYYLVIILEFYLLFPLFRLLINKFKPNLVSLASLSLILQIFIWVSKLLTKNPAILLLRGTFLQYIFYFVVGYILFRLRDRKLPIANKKRIMYVIATGLLSSVLVCSSWILNLKKINILIPNNYYFIVDVVISPILVLVTIFFCFFVVDKYLAKIKPLHYLLEILGKYSYSIYLFHMFPIIIFSELLLGNNIEPFHKTFYLLLTFFTVLVIMTAVFLLDAANKVYPKKRKLTVPANPQPKN